MEIGGRQVNAAAVHVGVVAAQAERLGANDAAVNDEVLPELKSEFGVPASAGTRFGDSRSPEPPEGGTPNGMPLNSLRMENSLRRSMASAPSLQRTL